MRDKYDELLLKVDHMAGQFKAMETKNGKLELQLSNQRSEKAESDQI